MSLWNKQKLEEADECGLARAAMDGATSDELLAAAVHTILKTGEVDRAGAWIELGAPERHVSAESSVGGLAERSVDSSAENSAGSSAKSSARDSTGNSATSSVRTSVNSSVKSSARNSGASSARASQGFVADRNGDATAAEWNRFSPLAILPQQTIITGQSIDQDLDPASNRTTVGPLLEMRRAVWASIGCKESFRGVLMAAVRRKNAPLPRALLESVAGELALAFALAETRTLARDRHNDVALVARTLGALENSDPDALLQDLADSCTEGPGKPLGPDAVFAAITSAPRSGKDSAESIHEKNKKIFLWRSGDTAWIRAIENEPLSSIWKRALTSNEVAGGKPSVASVHGELERIVATPVESDGRILGVLVAGFRPGYASLASLERLKLRATLISAAFLRRERIEKASRHAILRQALLDDSEQAIVLLDADGRLANLNRAAQEMLTEASPRTQAAEIPTRPGMKFRRLFAESAQLQIASLTQPASRTEDAGLDGAAVETELSTGARVRLRYSAIEGTGMALAKLEPLSSSITATSPHRANIELLNVLEWLEEGVVVFDAHDEICVINSRFAQIAGISPEKWANIKAANDLAACLALQAAEPESFTKHWHELGKNLGNGVLEELQFVRPVPRILERAARPILDDSGRYAGRVEIYRDLTAQRVFQSKLLQTEKLAALGQMVTGVAHELSNPLTTILGYAQRLMLRDDVAVHSEETRRIFQEAERASGILRQLLATARDARPERRRVALNQIVSRAIELQRFALSAEKIRLELDLDPVLPFLTGDANQLQQVLMNLIGNSRQAIEQLGTGGAIQIRTRRTEEGRVLLRVSDNGPGIPDTIRARIFDPFFTTKPAGVGTGLGLAVVLGIVREHGGKVDVRNASTGGAIFSIEFPSAPAEELRSQSTRPGHPRPTSPLASVNQPLAAVGQPNWEARQGNGIRALVVEDEPTVARLISDVLQDEGMRVDMVSDGREALERITREKYDLIVCDMKMPGLDGQSLYNSLAQRPDQLPERFLFVTGDAVAAQTREFLEQHKIPCLTKPFLLEELTAKTRHLLADRRDESRASDILRTKAARK